MDMILMSHVSSSSKVGGLLDEILVTRQRQASPHLSKLEEGVTEKGLETAQYIRVALLLTLIYDYIYPYTKSKCNYIPTV